MHDIGGLIWIVLVIIGVLSSISSSVRKSRRQSQQAPAPPVTQQPVVTRQAPAGIPEAFLTSLAVSGGPEMPQAAPGAAALARRVMPRAAQPPPARPVEVRPEPPPRREAPAPASESTFPLSGGVLGGIFEEKHSMLRAIVAAEVLGAPKALQEQSIWSPRHSEPSI